MDEIGFAIGFFGFIIGIWGLIVTYNQAQNKELAYEVTASPWVSIREEIKDDIEIRYKGDPIPDVHSISIRVSNTGTDPVNSSDYGRPISFSFGSSAQILDADITYQNPKGLNVAFLRDDATAKIEIVPTLINSSNEFILTVLVSQPDEILVDWFIAGVEKVKNGISPSRPKTERFLRPSLIVWIATTVALILLTLPRFNGQCGFRSPTAVRKRQG